MSILFTILVTFFAGMGAGFYTVLAFMAPITLLLCDKTGMGKMVGAMAVNYGALAGANGDAQARIFTTSLEAELVSIAGMYRTTDNELPDNVRGKAAQVRLDGEKLLIEPL